MNVDAVKHWTGDALLIAGDDLVRAGTRFDRIAVKPARAGVRLVIHVGWRLPESGNSVRDSTIWVVMQVK